MVQGPLQVLHNACVSRCCRATGNTHDCNANASALTCFVLPKSFHHYCSLSVSINNAVWGMLGSWVLTNDEAGIWGSYIAWRTWTWITFTFMHLADAFIQSDLHCIQVTVYFILFFLSALAFPGNRTHDLGIASAMLYYLSYRKQQWEKTWKFLCWHGCFSNNLFGPSRK